MSDPRGSDQPSAAEFFAQLGRATVAWGRVESMLCTAFQRLTRMQPAMARRVFYSARSFQGRADMLKATLTAAQTAPKSFGQFLSAALKKAGHFSSTRNAITHGDAVYMDATDSPWHGQHVIVQGRESWISDHKTVLTQDQLSIAEGNFGSLGFALLVVLSWDGQDTVRSPDKYLQLVQALPNQAHSTRLDPSFLAGFEFPEREVEIRR